jgi:hypothetical protein
MKIVYIAHPIAGDPKRNAERVKQIVRRINLTTEMIVPFAPYLVDLEVLDDNNPRQRKRGIKNDHELLMRGFIDELWLYGQRISQGMLEEAKLCIRLGIPVVAMSHKAEEEYGKIHTYRELWETDICPECQEIRCDSDCANLGDRKQNTYDNP